MTDENWNPEDWLVDFPDPQPYTGLIVSMPLSGKVVKVTRYILGEIEQEAYRCLNAQAELGALLLCLAAVDYMAGFYVGHKSKKREHIGFIKKYFPQKYRNFLEVIYDQLRSGLMHNMVAMNPWYGKRGIDFLIHPKSESHLEKTAKGKTIFSVGIFLEDVRRAWLMYAHDLLMKGGEMPEMVKKFNRRFNKLDGAGALMIRVPD